MNPVTVLFDIDARPAVSALRALRRQLRDQYVSGGRLLARHRGRRHL